MTEFFGSSEFKQPYEEKIDVATAKEQYPNGILIYYYPDKQRLPTLFQTLQKALPKHLIIPTAEGDSLLYPEDMGVQTDRHFYTYSGSKQYLQSVLERKFSDDYSFALPLLIPSGKDNSDMIGTIEGGKTVSIGNTNIILLTNNYPITHGEVIRSGKNVINMTGLLSEWRKYIEQTGRTVSNTARFDANHWDLFLTGFLHPTPQNSQRISWYVDSDLYTFLSIRNEIRH